MKDTTRQDVLPRLEGGFLSARDHAARGTIFPQPRVSVGGAAPVLLDERAGHGWRLVIDDQMPGTAVHGLTLVQLGAASLVETEDVVAAWMQRHCCHAALVRPDHYVFGVAASAGELDGLLTEWAALRGVRQALPW